MHFFASGYLDVAQFFGFVQIGIEFWLEVIENILLLETIIFIAIRIEQGTRKCCIRAQIFLAPMQIEVSNIPI